MTPEQRARKFWANRREVSSGLASQGGFSLMTDITVHWFGAPWGAPLNDDCPQDNTPVGIRCLQCSQPIGPDDRGVTMLAIGFEDRTGYLLPGNRIAVHLHCHLKSIAAQ